MLKKRLISAGLAAIFAITSMTMPAFADDKKSNDKGKGNKTSIIQNLFQKDDKKSKSKNINPTLRFGDSNDVSWASKSIEKMGALGIFSGDNNKMFRPSANVSNLEAVVMVLKLTGNKDAAEKIKNIHPLYKGGKLTWGFGYIYLAIEKGIITPDEIMSFKPNTPSKRYEVAKYLVRALGKNDEALQHMDETLSFNDSQAVPKDAVGYVYLVKELNIMTGSNGNFMPNKTISRAEMAVLIDRASDLDNTSGSSDDKLIGRFVSLNDDASKITIKYSNSNTKIYSMLSDSIPVYKDNRFTTVESLATTDNIRLVLNSQAKVIFIEVVKTLPDDSDDNTNTKISGTTVSYNSLPSTLKAQVDTIKLTQNYKALLYGNYVYLIASRGAMSTSGFNIKITDVYKDQQSNGKYAIEATVELTDPSNGSINTQVINYPYSIYKFSNFSGIDTLSFIDKNGNFLGQTRVVEADDAVTVTGTIAAIDKTTRTLTIKKSNNSLIPYMVSEDAVVKIDNVNSTFSDLAANMQVSIITTNDVATSVIASSNFDTISGTVAAIDIATRTLTVKKSDKNLVPFVIPQNAVIKINNTVSSISNLAVNMPVTVTLNSNIITTVSATDNTQTVTGTIAAVDKVTRTLTVKKSDNTLQPYVIPKNAVIKVNNAVTTFPALAVDMPVSIIVDKTVITAVSATDNTQTYTGSIAGIDSETRTLTVKRSNNALVPFVIPQNATIKVNNIVTAFSALAINMTVSVMTDNNVVAIVSATDNTQSVTGTIAAINTNTQTLTIKKSDNTFIPFVVPQNAVIKLNNTVTSFSALVINMPVTILTDSNVVTAINAADYVRTVSGTIDSIVTSSRTLKVLANNEINQYNIPESAAMTLNNGSTDFAHLQKNMKVSLTIINGVVSSVSATDIDEALSATFITFDSVNSIIYVKVGNTLHDYTVTNDTDIDLPENITLNNLAANSPILLTFRNDNLIHIQNN